MAQQIRKNSVFTGKIQITVLVLIAVISYGSVLLCRFSLVSPFPGPFLLFGLGQILDLVFIIVAIIAFILASCVKRWRSTLGYYVKLLILAILFGLPLLLNMQAIMKNPIHDISTALNKQLAFQGKEANYHSKTITSAYFTFQQTLYPQLKPLKLQLTEQAAYNKSLKVAKKMGWSINYQNNSNIIQAVATTSWFQFKDDIIIVIEKKDDAVLINLRSASRVGESDLGENHRRIVKFQKLMQR